MMKHSLPKKITSLYLELMDLVFLVINDLLNREYIHWMRISKQSMDTPARIILKKTVLCLASYIVFRTRVNLF